MRCRRLLFSAHAIRRMFERRVGADEVRQVLQMGDIIATYPDDKPYPSCLLLGIVAGRPLHVVVSMSGTIDAEADFYEECQVITVYSPDPEQWRGGYRTRRRP